MSSQNSNVSNYNQIFEKLVVNTEETSKERLIGMLAYAEYKLDKHDWKCDNQNASKAEIAAFLSHYNERVLQKYRTDAENVLLAYAATYAESILNDKLDQFKKQELSQKLDDFQNNLNDVKDDVQNHQDSAKDHLAREIQAAKTGFWMPVWQSITASIFFTSFLFISALTIRFAAPDTNVGQLLQYLLDTGAYKIKIEKK